jgi:hypothetical protein
MALCQVVIQMADAVAAARAPLTSREQRLIDAIKQISHFSDMNRLELWENAVNAASWHPVETVTQELLEEIVMLGLCNFYQKFNVSRTREYYARLVQFVAQHGVTIPECADVTDW